MTNLFIEVLHPDAVVPFQATTEAAGMDITALLWRDVVVYPANIESKPDEDDAFVVVEPKLTEKDVAYIDLMPNERAMIPTGLRLQAGKGFCEKLYPRSGNSIKRGLALANCVGIIDRDFKNEMMVLVQNNSSNIKRIHTGMKICQLTIEPVITAQVMVVDALPVIETNRIGGFGSTNND